MKEVTGFLVLSGCKEESMEPVVETWGKRKGSCPIRWAGEALEDGALRRLDG